jgi:uncharacterized protein
MPVGLAENPPDRCYRCKRELFSAILHEARCLGTHGQATVLDGTNAEDREEDRPGMRALRELGIASPLREFGFTKRELRALSQERGLATWDKPALACLLTRLPFQAAVSLETLKRVELAEERLRALGLRIVRVRDHGTLARIETAPEERLRFFEAQMMERVVSALQALGYRRVALDLEGYRGAGMEG